MNPTDRVRVALQDWNSRFPVGYAVALSCEGAAIAVRPDPDSFTKARYYAREVVAGIRAPQSSSVPWIRLYGPLLGPVDTMAAAVKLCTPANQAALEPPEPPR